MVHRKDYNDSAAARKHLLPGLSDTLHTATTHYPFHVSIATSIKNKNIKNLIIIVMIKVVSLLPVELSGTILAMTSVQAASMVH